MSYNTVSYIMESYSTLSYTVQCLTITAPYGTVPQGSLFFHFTGLQGQESIKKIYQVGKIIMGIYLCIIKLRDICAYFVEITCANINKTQYFTK